MDLIGHVLLGNIIYGYSPSIILGSVSPDLFFAVNNFQKLPRLKRPKKELIKNFIAGKRMDHTERGRFYDLGLIFHSFGMTAILMILKFLINRPSFSFFVYGYILHILVDFFVHRTSITGLYLWPFKNKIKIGFFVWNFLQPICKLFYLVIISVYLIKFLLVPIIDINFSVFYKYWYAILFIFPAYVANVVPVLFSRVKIFNKPVDFGKKIGGKRIFGSHKTWRGVFFASFYGCTMGFLQGRTFIGFLLGLGAMFGDLIASFVKRRLGFEPGGRALFLDQLNLLIGALFLVYIFGFLNLDTYQIIFLLIFTFFIHYLSSVIGYLIKVKKNPW